MVDAKYFKRETLYEVLLLVALVTIILLPWHAQSHRVPFWDEAAYVETAQNILASFKDGCWEGLKGIYQVRGWRPIIFPAVFSAFLAIAQGKIILGVGLAQWFTLSLVAVYTYLLMREILPGPRALVGAGFVVTTPWILNFSYVLFSELFWLATTVAFVFHMFAASNRRPVAHLAIAGIWLGLMGATRPAETVLIMALPILARLFVEWRERKVPVMDVAIFALQALLLAAPAVSVIQSLPPYHLSLLLLIAGVALIAWRARRFFVMAPVFGMVIVAEVVFIAWFGTYMRQLYFWVFETSFGPLANS